MGAAARRKGFGFSRPAAFGGPLCGLPNAMLANPMDLLSVNPETLYFYCGHHPPTNARRSLVCHPVLIPDKLSHGNSEGTNRSQNADRECGGFDKVTVTRSRSTVTLFGVTVTRFVTVTALKQRRFDIFRLSGAGRLYDLHPQDSTVTTVTRSDILKLKYAATMTSAEVKHHPTTRNNVLGVSVFSCQDAVLFL